ncbi:MAG TPA: LysR substrate-binding domain-containing protein [Opitutales bacterium]|jgi:DNA-binding transcriptional LysR family regulator|nr:LysR substrate-binding domain-containing protein [Opitutales bacterium]
MELRHLRYFVAVAEELNVRRAAARLRVSQPPLSRQIHDLEDEVGAKLFQRSKRGMQLTEAGRYLLPQARQILAQSERALHLANAASRGEAGRLSIAYSAAVFDPAFASAVRLFRHRFPLVDLEMRELSFSAQIKALLDSHIDTGYLVLGSREGEEELDSECLRRVATCIALPRNHPLTKRKHLKLSDLVNEPFIFPRQSMSTFRNWLLELCRASGFVPKIVQEADNAMGIMGLVASGVGVAFSPETGRIFQSMGVEFRALPPGTPMFELHILWRRDNTSPLLPIFLQILRESTRMEIKNRANGTRQRSAKRVQASTRANAKVLAH